MKSNEVASYTAFEGYKKIVSGPLSDVVLKLKKRLGKNEHSLALIFSDTTGKSMDFNFQGTEKDVLKRLEMFVSPEAEDSSGPGRPKLGVVSREVSLLPRHWEWLAAQSGGASAALRKLIEDAKKKSSDTVSVKQAQENAHRFMSALAGDLKGYQEALRFLYRREQKKFLSFVAEWPKDVREYTVELAKGVFGNS